MGHAQRLRLSDVRAIFDLVGEVRELGHDPLGWRRHMLEGLCRLTGALVGSTGEMTDVQPGGRTALHPVLDIGWPGPRQRVAFLTYMMQVHNPTTDPVAPIVQRRPGRTTTVGPDLLSHCHPWYGRAAADYRHASELEHWMCSITPLSSASPGHVQAILLIRGRGERPYSQRQLRVVHVFHEELARLWDATEEGSPVAGLPRRLRETLGWLRAGHSEKQAAEAMGLSRKSVHKYVRALHQRYGVRTRAELLTRTRDLGPESRLRLRMG